MGILTIGVPLGKAQKCTYVTLAPGAALRLPRVVDATCRRQTQNTVPLRTILPLIYLTRGYASDVQQAAALMTRPYIVLCNMWTRVLT